MIDTDKYEGHTPGPWKTSGYDVQAIKIWTVDGLDETENWIQIPMADRLLAVDAPLLLEEVKRLREIIQVQIVTPRSKALFLRHYGKDDFEERWKEWADRIQSKVWGRKE